VDDPDRLNERLVEQLMRHRAADALVALSEGDSAFVASA
jgi:hypothetical protein